MRIIKPDDLKMNEKVICVGEFVYSPKAQKRIELFIRNHLTLLYFRGLNYDRQRF